MKNTIKYTIILMMACGVVSAASWSAVYTETLVDGVGYDGTIYGSGQNIDSGSWGQDSNYFYFKMEMVGDIQGSGGNNFASIYGLYIDANPLQEVTGINYVPSTLSGIDTVPDLHFTGDGTNAWVASSHYHTYNSSTSFNDNLITAFDADSEWDGGKVLEWKIAKSLFTGPFSVVMGTQTENVNQMHDLLNLGTVPEPATVALLGLGLLGLRKKRK